MKYLSVKWLVILLLLAVLSCEESSPELSDKVLIDGVMYRGKSVNNLRLWSLSDLRVTNPTPLLAEAVVVRNGEIDYFFTPDASEPGSYLDASGLLDLIPGQFYQLFVVRNEELILSATQVPLPLAGLNTNQDQYAVNAQDRNNGSDFSISWNNPNGQNAIGKINLVTDPLTKIDPFADENPALELLLPATKSDQYQVPFNEINYYGTYRLVLYAINQEYLDFFGNSSPEVRVQQFTNVFNGLGIFTAVTPDTVYFEVIPN